MSAVSGDRTFAEMARIVWADVRRVDRTEIVPLATWQERAPMLLATVVSVALLYTLGWGGGIYVAVRDLMAGAAPASATTEADLAMDVLVPLLVAAGGVVFIRMILGRRPEPAGFKAALRTIPMACIATAMGFAAVNAIDGLARLPNIGYPTPTNLDGFGMHALYLLSSMSAGPSEEIVLLGLVAVGLRRCGAPWWVVYIAAVAVRIPFHLYYGWGAFGLSIWVLLSVAIFRRTGSLLGLIIQHSLWDVLTDLGWDHPYKVLCAVAFFLLLCRYLLRLRGGVSIRWRVPTA